MDLIQQSHESLPILLDDRYTGLVRALQSKGIITMELLMASPESIARETGKATAEIESFVNEYKKQLGEHFQSKLTTVPDGSSSTLSFTTGDDGIDATLNGGIPVGYLIEVSGSSSTGKSNMLMSLAMTIQLPVEFGGLGSSIFEHSQVKRVKTMYISTESSLSTTRLEQIAKYYRQLLKSNGITDDIHHPDMANVITTSGVINDLDSQDRCIFYQLPALLERDREVKLVILDSITHHARAELKINERDEYVTKVCQFLKSLARQYSVTVMVANQMTDKPLRGIFSSQNDLLYKLSFDYQSSWLVGWDDVSILYRQMMVRHRKKSGLAGEEQAEELDYERLGYGGESQGNADISMESNGSVTARLQNERKHLFESKYRAQVSKIKTIPALGLALLNMVDMRIVLRKSFIPILGANLIDEFSTDLGIGNSVPKKKDGDKKTSFADILASNDYLSNNFEVQRTMKVVFSPLIPAGPSRDCKFEIWKGGIRHC